MIGSRSNARRWLAVAAAAVLVIGGVVAIAWTRATGDGTADSSQPVETPPVTTDDGATITPSSAISSTSALPVETVPATSAPTASAVLPMGRAVAEPATVLAGEAVTITPARTIERACDYRFRTTRHDGSVAGQNGAISPGSWSVDAAAQVREPNCTGDEMVTDEPLTIGIPRNMPAGTYEICLTASRDVAGCAQVTVHRSPNEATAEPATVTPGELVTITPVGVIKRTCQDVVTAIPLANAASTSGQLVGGRWLPASGSITQVTYPPCEGEVSDAAVQIVVAADMPPGVYAMCVVEQASYDIQGTSDPGCAIVTVIPSPLPACWTEPVAPPTLSDGSVPGTPTFDQAGQAVWGDRDSSTVRQTLGSEPSSWWLDESPDGMPQVSSGSVRAAVAIAGDWEGGPKIILVRGLDGCDRQYDVGLLRLDEAVALAQQWVDALALAATVPSD